MGLIIALVIPAGLFWLLWHFRLRRATTLAELRQLILPVLVISGFLIVVGLFNLAAQSRLHGLASQSALSSLAQIESARGTVVVEGQVSEVNPPRYQKYVAYVRYSTDEEGDTWRETPPLKIELANGTVDLDNDDYAAINWRRDTEGWYIYSYLTIGERVIVSGDVVRGVIVAGPQKGTKALSIRADQVLAGSHAEFAQRTHSQALLPAALWIASWLGGSAVLIITAIKAVTLGLKKR